jgi:hypothetical protein
VAGASIIQEPATLPFPTAMEDSAVPRAISCRVVSAKANRPATDANSAPHSSSLENAAGTRQSAQLPAFAPLLEELEVAGWSSHRRMLSGNFHDWLLLENRTLLVMTGQAIATPPNGAMDAVEVALIAQGAWAALRSHAQHVSDAGTLLSLAGRSLWSNVGIGLKAAVGIVDLEGGHASVAVAGDCLALRVRAAGCEQIATHQPALGAESDFCYLSHSVQLSVRERMLLIADEPQRSGKLTNKITTAFGKLDAESHRRMTAADAIATVRSLYEEEAELRLRSMTSMVGVRRR